jgi:F-type H+-transporting ATPase subunit delta
LSAVANRYAKALVDVCLKLSVHDRVAEDLLAFENLLNTQTELRSLYLNPAVPVPKKKAITAEILKRFSFAQATTNFISVLIDQHRIGYFSSIRKAFHQLLNEQLGVVEAEVKMASDLDPATQDLLLARLNELTGRKVTLKFTKDPDIIGGIVTRIGDTIYDGSIRQRLNTLKAQLRSD